MTYYHEHWLFFFFLKQGAQSGLEFESLASDSRVLGLLVCTFIPNYFISLSLFLLFGLFEIEFHTVAWTCLELTTLLTLALNSSLASKFWDYKCEPPHPALYSF